MMRFDRALLAGIALACAGPVVAQAQISETVRYTVRRGDTLLGLTAQYLYGPAAYRTLVASNRLPDTERIYPGNVLNIPVAIMRSTPLEARVTSFKGNVSIVQRGKPVPIAMGMAVRVGDVVQTAADGFVTILLSNGSRMTLPTQTRIRVMQMRQLILTKSTDFDFMVEQGRTELSVTPATSPNNLFRLRTPIAVSAVRGTKFRIGYGDLGGPSLTEVIDGTVAVNGANPSISTALVPAGFGAAASANGDLGTEALLPAPVIIDSGKLWRNRLLDFELVPVATARGYRLQIARDEAFENLVAETRSPGPRLRIGRIDDGTYFARATAIAPSGLEGLSQTAAIKRAIAPLTAVVETDGRHHYFAWQTDGRGNPVFRFQLFADRIDGVPVINETGMTTYDMTIGGLGAGRYLWRVGMQRVADGRIEEIWTEPEQLQIPAQEQ